MFGCVLLLSHEFHEPCCPVLFVESFILYLFCPEFFFLGEKNQLNRQRTCFSSACFSCVVSSLLLRVKSHCAMCLLQADHTVWTEDRMSNTYCLKKKKFCFKGPRLSFSVTLYSPSDIYLCLWVIKAQWLKCKSSLCLDIWCHVDLMSREPWSNTTTLQFYVEKVRLSSLNRFTCLLFRWNVMWWTWSLRCKHMVKVIVTSRGW